ncbi:hypothetical protein BJV82DRAFT_632626 [Fennellomyces sp. T-0311]|nr:hypothetical protein BJV82DRAFT_632626 [Fennellomyces sp. T-0311]
MNVSLHLIFRNYSETHFFITASIPPVAVRRGSSSSSSDTEGKNTNGVGRRPKLAQNDADDPATASRYSTDDEGSRVTLNGSIPPDMPLEVLAGKGLVTNYTDDQFDWTGGDEGDEDDDKEKKKSQPGIVLCLSRNSSYIAWSLLILFALILIAVDVAVFIVYDSNPSMISYNLQLWFSWAAFIWVLSMILQVIVELVPWAIKRMVGILRPQSTEVLRMRLAYYMALRPYIKLLMVSAWNWGSWAFISNIVARPADSEGRTVDKPSYVGVIYSIWQCVFFAALLLFIEKFLLQLIVTSFHKKAYGYRIDENDRALKMLDKLKKTTTKRKMPQEFILKRIRRNKHDKSNKPSRSASADDGQPPHANKTQSIMRPDDNASRGTNVHFPSSGNMDTLIAIPPIERSDDEKKDAIDSERSSPEQPQREKPQRGSSNEFFSNLSRRLRDISTKPTKRQINRHPQPTATSTPGESSPRPSMSRSSTWASSFTKSFDERSFIKGSSKKAWNAKHQQPYHGRSHQAKALAKRIHHNLTSTSGRDEITEMDFYPYFRTNQEAAEAFRLFDNDGNGSISKTELRSTCVRIYRERKNLATSMRDLSQATGKLDIILIVVFTLVWVIIVCASFGVNVGTSLMPLWSAFIAASFVFGNSAKDAFESIIFVFVTHPFDAGDRVLIGPENWVVQNVGLLVSTFVNWDGSIVYAKNSVLATQYITNVRRTGPTGESLQIHIAFSTPSAKIHSLIDHMKEWSNQYPALYRVNSTSANILTFENQNRLTMSFYFEHTQNWQDPGGRWLRHNNFMMELKEECERLNINYVLPSQPFESHKDQAVPEMLNDDEDNNDDDDNNNGSSGGLHMRRQNEVGAVRGPTGAGIGASSGTTGNGGNGNGAAAGAAATVAFTTGFM